MRLDLQNELDSVNQRMEEASGQLSAQIHLNSTRKLEVTTFSSGHLFDTKNVYCSWRSCTRSWSRAT